MSTNNADELFALVSKFMLNLEIIEPIEWREKYIENLKNALHLYNKNG